MNKPRRGKGFAYIDALIAAAVISAVFIPVISVFYTSAQNQNYAVKYYKAAAQAELALAAAGCALEVYGAETDFGEILSEKYFLRDEFDFIISTGDEPGVDFYIESEPEIIFGEPSDWETGSFPRQSYSDADGVRLVIEGSPAPVENGFTLTVDVYDKNGKFLARAARLMI